MPMKFSVKGKVMTYTVCGGDDDRTGDEGEAVIHADLKRGFPAMTWEPRILSMWARSKGPRAGHTGPPRALL